MLWISLKAYSSKPETTTTERFLVELSDIVTSSVEPMTCLLRHWSGKEPPVLETLLQQNKCCNDNDLLHMRAYTYTHIKQLLNKVTRLGKNIHKQILHMQGSLILL